MGYKIVKRLEVAGSHSLKLDYDSPCANLHGHNWIITVEVEGDFLDPNGMLIDFTHIKEVVDVLDHENLNEVFPFQPSAENIANWVSEQVQLRIDMAWQAIDNGTLDGITSFQFIFRPHVTAVSVQESEGNVAWYFQNLE